MNLLFQNRLSSFRQKTAKNGGMIFSPFHVARESSQAVSFIGGLAGFLAAGRPLELGIGVSEAT
jgi:hypothetical protein